MPTQSKRVTALTDYEKEALMQAYQAEQIRQQQEAQFIQQAMANAALTRLELQIREGQLRGEIDAARAAGDVGLTSQQIDNVLRNANNLLRGINPGDIQNFNQQLQLQRSPSSPVGFTLDEFVEAAEVNRYGKKKINKKKNKY